MNVKTISPLSRRALLRQGLSLMGLSATVPAFLNRMAHAITQTDAAGTASSLTGAPDERILVVVQLAGGNDGLNTVIPYENDLYYNYRPTLAIKKNEVLQLNEQIGLHPAATGMKALYDEGLLSVVQGVGYPNPNRSHFSSTEIWQTASPEETIKDGWLGRYFDAACIGTEPSPSESAIALTEELPTSLRGDLFEGMAFQDANQLRWRGSDRNGLTKVFDRLNDPTFAAVPNEPPTLQYLRRVAAESLDSAAQIRQAVTATKNTVEYNWQSFSRQLMTVARLIAYGIPSRVYYVSLGGFDTHSSQDWRHRSLIEQLSIGLQTFVTDLKNMGQLDRVLILTFSEFGRRVEENASRGTDHGAAAPMFIAGNTIFAGIHGEHPSLDKDQLDRGDLAYQIDFRQVYAAVLRDWFQMDPYPVLKETYEPLPIMPAYELPKTRVDSWSIY